MDNKHKPNQAAHDAKNKQNPNNKANKVEFGDDLDMKADEKNCK
jgi:hypothetical protein